MLTEPPLPSSLLAFVTTIHLALALLRNHRRMKGTVLNTLALVSLAFAISPWILPSLAGLALGLAAHAAWFVACEWFFGPPVPAPSTSRPSLPAQRSTQVPEGHTRAPRSTSFVQVPVLAAFDETSDIKTIRLARPEEFGFDAGQFVTLRIHIDGKEYARCYSISSSPEMSGYLEISIKRQGVVSNALHATARPGALVSIKSPNGRFRYPSSDDRPIVLVAAGVGITPLMSMLRHAISVEPMRPVTLLYGSRSNRDFAFRDELVNISKRHPQTRILFAASREPSPCPDVYPGRIDENLIRSTVPDVAHAISFVCGPKSMISETTTLLANLGVPPAQIRSEAFEAAIAASASSSPARGLRLTPHLQAGLKMRCAMTGKTVPIAPGQTLLDAAESGGVSVPSLCRAGVCGTCRTRVTDGEVECESTTLNAEEQRDGFVLACVATARSACTVEL